MSADSLCLTGSRWRTRDEWRNVSIIQKHRLKEEHREKALFGVKKKKNSLCKIPTDLLTESLEVNHDERNANCLKKIQGWHWVTIFSFTQDTFLYMNTYPFMFSVLSQSWLCEVGDERHEPGGLDRSRRGQLLHRGGVSGAGARLQDTGTLNSTTLTLKR